MSSKLTPTALPTPPKEYDVGYMDRLVKQIALEFTKQRATTPITCGSDLSGEAGFPISGLTIVNPPISSTGSPPDGFPEGSVWCDTTSENSLKIITSGPYTDQDSLNLANTTDPALGDALIGFRQSNASGNLTGAVGRTVHEKLQETISIKDFGAVGNNVTDDAPYIQAALNYAGTAGGVEVLVPPGTYKIMSSLQMPSNVTLRGVTSLQGGGASFRFGGAYAFATPSGAGFHIFNIYNLAIWGTRGSTDFIDQSGGGSWAYSTVANCYIVNFRNFHTLTTGNHFLNNNFQNMVSMEFRGGDYSVEDNYIGYDDQDTTKGAGDSLLTLIASTGVDFSRNYMTSWDPANPANTPIVLDVQNSSDIRVVSNWIDGGTNTSMLISGGSQKIIATHNRFGVIFPATCVPLGLSNVTDVTIRDNIIANLNASAPFISFASTLARCIVADNIINSRTDTTTHDYSSATVDSGVTMSGYGLSIKDTAADIDIFPPLYGRTIINQSTTGLVFFYVYSTKFTPGQSVNFSRTNTANRLIVRDADTATNIYDSNTSGFNTGRVICYVLGTLTVENIA